MTNKYSPEYRTRKTWTVWIFVALLCALLLNSLAGDFFKRTFYNLLSALTPLIVGLVITFLFKKILDFLEKKVFAVWFKKLKHGDKVNRIFCIALLFVGLFVVLFLCLNFVLPQIISFVQDINNNLNSFVSNLKNQLTDFFESTGWFNDVDVNQMITDFINKLVDSLTTNIPLIAESLSNIIQQSIVFIMYFLVGIIISMMLLYKKEKVAEFSKRLTYATLSQSKADKLVKTARLTDKILYDYVGAKCIEAVIVFALMLPGYYLFKIPYPLAMAFIMAILNMIPYVGSVIATIPIVILCIAFVDVKTAIWIVIYDAVVLNIYGNCIGPFIYGRRMKVSALLIILSMLLFGSIFGFWGLIIGPPLMAVLWDLTNDFIADKENEKLELEKYNLTKEDINDLEILQEATKIVKERREAQQKMLDEKLTAQTTATQKAVVGASDKSQSKTKKEMKIDG